MRYSFILIHLHFLISKVFIHHFKLIYLQFILMIQIPFIYLILMFLHSIYIFLKCQNVQDLIDSIKQMILSVSLDHLNLLIFRDLEVKNRNNHRK